MTKEQHVAKAVLGHDWTNLEDWVQALAELADMRDEQIEQLKGIAPVEGGKQA